MQMVEQKDGEVLTLSLAGRLDGVTSKGVEERILGLIDGGARRLLLDLAALEYISSIGLRVLMLAAKRMKAVDGKLAVSALRPAIRKVFDIAGFDTVLHIVATRAEGVQDLSA